MSEPLTPDEAAAAYRATLIDAELQGAAKILKATIDALTERHRLTVIVATRGECRKQRATAHAEAMSHGAMLLAAYDRILTLTEEPLPAPGSVKRPANRAVPPMTPRLPGL